jgi:Ala-tRNA(Pro) deacylase
MNGDPHLYDILLELNIGFAYYEHPAAFTVAEALKNWEKIDATHCKNLFFRNHKGDRHYLVIMEYSQPMAIHDLEQRLHQGKLSFASQERLKRYLGVTPGAVSVFNLINDKENHVHVFLDEKLRQARKISFHPNDNTASIVITNSDLMRFLDWCGNTYEFLRLD